MSVETCAGGDVFKLKCVKMPRDEAQQIFRRSEAVLAILTPSKCRRV